MRSMRGLLRLLLLQLRRAVCAAVAAWAAARLLRLLRRWRAARGLRGRRAIVIGAGCSGIVAGKRLRELGVEYVILEKAAACGGTWLHNSYPGCGCDVSSHLYSFSFEPKADWTMNRPKRDEFLAYVQGAARRHGVIPHIRFNSEVTSAEWDPRERVWRVYVAGNSEPFIGDVLISGAGQLNIPAIPAIPGAEAFQGAAFHSAEYRHDVPLAGRRVAVIGAGPTAAQLVPRVADTAGELVVFQRTPNWYFAGRDVDTYAYSALQIALFRLEPLRLLYRYFVFVGGELLWSSLGSLWIQEDLRTRLARAVPEEGLRRKLEPEYPPGCKRVVIGDASLYLRALRRPHVTVETADIRRFTPTGIEMASGTVHEVDVVIYATGFRTHDFLYPMKISAEGRSLAGEWNGTPSAYLGVTVPHFPNFFMLYGPNTNLGANSIIFMIECQMAHIAAILEHMGLNGLRTCEVREEVARAFNEEQQAGLRDSVYARRCNSWYKTESGRIVNNWHTNVHSYWWRTRAIDGADFEFDRGGSAVARSRM